MQNDLHKIRDRDAQAPRGTHADSALGEIEWKMHGLMISSGLVLGPIVALVVIAGLLWLWLA
jgi:hypothetical protein